MTKKKWSSRFKDVPLDFRGPGCFWKIKKKKLDSLWKRKELLHLRRRKRKTKTKATKNKNKNENKQKQKQQKLTRSKLPAPSGWKSYIPNCCIIVMVNNVPGHLGHRIILLSTTVIVILYFNLNIFQNFRMF